MEPNSVLTCAICLAFQRNPASSAGVCGFLKSLEEKEGFDTACSLAVGAPLLPNPPRLATTLPQLVSTCVVSRLTLSCHVRGGGNRTWKVGSLVIL